MSKKVAVVAVNPVNGLGLFSYLETFFENKVDYRVFAVYDDVIAHLVGKSNEYDALVFACGDAVPVFAQNMDKPYNQMLLQVIKEFGQSGKLLIGHCGAGVFFDMAEVDTGRQVACHPYVKDTVKNGVYSDAPYVVDGTLFTAAEENELHLMLPEVVKALQ